MSFLNATPLEMEYVNIIPNNTYFKFNDALSYNDTVNNYKSNTEPNCNIVFDCNEHGKHFILGSNIPLPNIVKNKFNGLQFNLANMAYQWNARLDFYYPNKYADGKGYTDVNGNDIDGITGEVIKQLLTFQMNNISLVRNVSNAIPMTIDQLITINEHQNNILIKNKGIIQNSILNLPDIKFKFPNSNNKLEKFEFRRKIMEKPGYYSINYDDLQGGGFTRDIYGQVTNQTFQGAHVQDYYKNFLRGVLPFKIMRPNKEDNINEKFLVYNGAQNTLPNWISYDFEKKEEIMKFYNFFFENWKTKLLDNLIFVTSDPATYYLLKDVISSKIPFKFVMLAFYYYNMFGINLAIIRRDGVVINTPLVTALLMKNLQLETYPIDTFFVKIYGNLKKLEFSQPNAIIGNDNNIIFNNVHYNIWKRYMSEFGTIPKEDGLLVYQSNNYVWQAPRTSIELII
jgi:hypothetical protein